MTVQQPASARGARPAERRIEVLAGGLTREEIERYVARGRRERSDVIAAGIVRGFRALRRLFEGQADQPRGYQVHGKVRP